jgi:predicted dehydrogenase
MLEKPYRVAIIGRTGRGNYGHGLDTVWKAVPDIALVALADDDEAGGKAAAERLGIRAVYRDYRTMLRQERPQLVAVGPRWVDAHHDMVLACAEAGASVYMEKPMARSLDEADAMVEACDRAHVKLQLAHQMRLAPAILHARERIAAGEIGQVLELRARGKEDARAGGEDLMVLGTHVFDLMRFFGGEPLWVFAHVTQSGEALRREHARDGNEGLGPLAGDHIEALYAFPGGVHGSFSSKRCQQASGRGTRYGIDVRGSEGVIAIRAGLEPEIRILRSPSWLPARDGAGWEPFIAPKAADAADLAGDAQTRANRRMVLDLIDAIEKDRPPAMDARAGRWTLEMALGIYSSALQGKPAPLPLAARAHPLARA